MIEATFQDLAQIALNSKQELWNEAARVGREPHIYLHWSAGHYGQPFEDYHINIDQDGTLYLSTDNLATVLQHTWHNNTGCIGISMLCCAFATMDNLGDEPPTEEQIEAMSKVVALLCKYIGIPCNQEYIRTHAEQANIDDYGPSSETCERWDLAFLHDGDPMMSGGEILRGKANWYIQYGNL